MATPLRLAYFNRFPGFEPDLRRPLDEEFQRLARFQRWARKSNQYARERRHFLLAEFDQHLGLTEGSTKLEDWQALCRELSVIPLPGSIRQCKKALATKVHVNLIDLLNSRRQGTKVRVFKTRADLIRYTIATRKFFPKEMAKQEGLLKILLREIL